jgi:fatty acid amide hydrolase
VSQIGVLARRVADVALGTRIINGVNEEPPLPLGDEHHVDVEKLRVAYYTDDGTLQVAPAVARAVRESAEALRGSGAEVLEWSPPEIGEALHLYFALLSGDGGMGVRRQLQRGEYDPRIKVLTRVAGFRRSMRGPLRRLLNATGQPTMADFLSHFGYTSVDEHWQLVERQMDSQRRFVEALDRERIDAILCPPCALPAYTHGASADLGQAGGYGLLYNLLGFPAGVVPFTRVGPDEEVGRSESRDKVEKAALAVERGSAGLPVGVQVVGRPWREDVVLALMGELESIVDDRPDRPDRPDLT